MTPATAAIVNDAVIFALRHIENREEFICGLKDGVDYLVCFTSLTDAEDWRMHAGLTEHVDIVDCRVSESLHDHLYLDGEFVELVRKLGVEQC